MDIQHECGREPDSNLAKFDGDDAMGWWVETFMIKQKKFHLS